MEGSLRTSDLLDSRQFAIAIRRLADNFSYGTDRSPFLGSGVEYVQSRAYAPGDPIKSIDWRVTARIGKPFVKEYEAPKQMPCYLLIDTSASMTISSIPMSKYAIAVHIAGGLALACLDRMSPVGVVGVGGRELRMKPSLSKEQVHGWLHRLHTYRYDEPTNLRQQITRLGPRLESRAMLIVLSDLHEVGSLSSIKQVGQNHDVVVIQMRDPAEEQLPGAGLMRSREAESGREFVTHGRDTWLASGEIEKEFKRGGIDHILIRTDKPFAYRLRHFFQGRGILGRQAR